MIIEHAEFRVRDGSAREFEKAITAVQGLVLAAGGCRSAELLHSVDHPDTYLLRVHWERLEDHTEGFSSGPPAQRFATAIAPYCSGPPKIVHYDARALNGLESNERAVSSAHPASQ